MVDISVISVVSKNAIPHSHITVNGHPYQTDRDGKLQLNVKNCTLLTVHVGKDGYSSHDINGRFFVPRSFVFELEPQLEKHNEHNDST